MLNNFQPLPLIGTSSCRSALAITGLNDLNRANSEELIINYPNPFVDTTKITFKTNGGHTMIQVMDTQGKIIAVLTDKVYSPGLYTIDFNSGALPVGMYYARLQNGPLQQLRPMLKAR